MCGVQEREERTEGEERVMEKKVNVNLNLKKMVRLCGGGLWGFRCFLVFGSLQRKKS